MTKDQLLFILDQVGSLPLNLCVDYCPEDGMLELIPPSNPIHLLGLQDLKCRGIDLAPFDHLNLGQLSALELGGWDPSSEKEIMDLALKSASKDISIKWYMQLGPPSDSIFTHKLMGQVVRLDIEFGTPFLFCFFGHHN
jgi:hypothetical protein